MKKAIALLLAIILILGLAACGNATTVIVSNTNTENTENTDNTADADNTAENTENNAADNTENTTENDDTVYGIINPLTGEETEEDLSGYRPIAVSMNNEKAAMPQHGVSDADIIIEMNLNAKKLYTRMFCLFQNITADTTKIGAIRSARTYYLDWALAFDSVYVTASASKSVLAKIAERNVVYVNCNDNAATRPNPFPNIFYRDRDRLRAGYALEHTMFAHGSGFAEHKSDMNVQLEHRDGYECSLHFTYNQQAADGAEAPAFTVTMNRLKTTGFEYDTESKLYKVSQHGGPYIDGNNNEQVAVKNVLVLHTKYTRASSAGTTYIADMSGGKGAYFCEGKMIDIEWALSEEDGLKLTKADGTELKLAIGKTYIICPDTTTGKVTIKDGL